jgi:hypothetical protein
MICLTSAISFLVFSGLIAPQGPKEQQEYCAFEVLVKSPRNEPVPDAIVVMFDEDGKEFASAVVNEKGIARLCDAPPGLIRLSVGGNRCGAVSVSYLERYWMETRRIIMTYDNCSGQEWALLGGCMLTIRVKGKDGTPLVGVKLRNPEQRPKSRPQTYVSDRWGRIFQFLHFGDHLVATLEKDGYVPLTVSAECKPASSYDRDLTVTLEPIQRE